MVLVAGGLNPYFKTCIHFVRGAGLVFFWVETLPVSCTIMSTEMRMMNVGMLLGRQVAWRAHMW